MSDKTIVVIATYNEKDNLEKLVKEIFSLPIENLEMIVVDDGSPDGTGKIADELAKNYALEVIHRTGKLGLGSALITGFKRAIEKGAILIVSLDADFSHNPQDIPRLLAQSQSGFDIVIGSRKIAGGGVVGWNWWRRFCSAGAMWLSRLLLGLKTYDVTTNFRCYKKEALLAINYEKVKSNGYSFFEETIYLAEKANLKIKEVPVIFNDRTQGKSKLSRKEIIIFFITILRLRFGR
ncbi:MAG: polyprenol monophosphomannose synthase [bacterium]